MSDNPATLSMVAGRYQIDRQIDVGGMASVYLAQDTVLDRPVAVKVLHAHFAMDPAFVARFKWEAQAAARLTHPNVVAVYDWGPHDDSYYIAMEFVDGPTLAQELETGPLGIAAAIDIAIDVARALAAAHGQGTVHRDIKPSNIILGRSGGAKVADFGIARAVQTLGDGDLTDAGSVIGTAGYLSPEQANGTSAGPQSDLYSLGVVLFEMVAGRRPFVGSSSIAVLRQHIDVTPPSVRESRPSVPVELAALIEELLAKNPADRPASAAVLTDRLRRVRPGEVDDPVLGDDLDDATQVMDSTGRAAPVNRDSGLPPTAVMPPSARPDAPRAETSRPMPPAAPTPPAAPPARGSRTGWPIVAGVLAVLAVLVMLFVVGSQAIGGGDGSGESTDSTEEPSPASTTSAPTQDPSPDSVAVPDVRGASRADAESAIKELGLVPLIETQVLASGDDRVGRVISQRPGPGESLEPGADVVLVIGAAGETTTTTAPASQSTTVSDNPATSEGTTTTGT